MEPQLITEKALTGSIKVLLGTTIKEKRKMKTDAKTFDQPPRLVRSRRSCDMSKYFHFHEDHRHATNQFRELRTQIEEAIKSRQLAHLVKGIKKGNAKISDTQLGEWRKGDKDTTLSESPILVVNMVGHTSKRKSMKEPVSKD
ncbi:hypothetical protein Tco_0193103 [Tanacetum coccineum]